MPLYDFECDACGVQEHFAKMDEMERACECGKPMKRLISLRSYTIGDLQPYWDENLGHNPVYVESKQHRKKLMEKAGVSELYGKHWV